jgi:hypothetical protein
MKTIIETPPAFVPVPAVGTVPAFKVDPLNRAEVRALICRAESYFRLSARAWEDGNNSGNAETLARKDCEERSLARKGEALLKPFGIKCDWPGLYPSFRVGGFHEYTTENAVLSALGHPRNWLKG